MNPDQKNNRIREVQIEKWINSETDKSSSDIKVAEKIKFPREVQFLTACNSNDWAEIERLLSEGIDINCTQDDGLTALHQACIDKDDTLVKFLVEHDAIVDAKDKEGWTPLFAAISCGYLEITEYLINHGACLDVVSYDGELPLNQSNDEKITQYLKKEMRIRNFNEQEIKNRERTMMLNDVEEMRQTQNFDNFFLVDNGATMLHVAASKDYTDVLEKLLSFLPSELLNITDNDGWNALHMAAHWGFRRASIMLVEADIDFDQTTNMNQTVLEVSDDGLKPYVREEIRKARFRRQEKPVKRPAETPNGEYSPINRKVPCHDKDKSASSLIPIPTEPVPMSTESQNEEVQKVNGTASHDNTSTDNKTTDQSKKPTTAATQSKKPEPAPQDSTSSKKQPEVSSEKERMDDNQPAPVTDDKSAKKSPSLSSKMDVVSGNEPSSERKEQTSATDPKSPDSSSQNKAEQSEVLRLKESKTKRRTKKPTQTISEDDLLKAISMHQADSSNTGKESASSDQSSNISEESGVSSISKDKDPDETNNNSSNAPIDSNTQDTSIVCPQPVSPFSSINQTDPPQSASETNSTNDSSLLTSLDAENNNTNISRNKSGGHVVNKKRVRTRPPTQTVDTNDILAAQRKLDAENNSTTSVTPSTNSDHTDTADRKNNNTTSPNTDVDSRRTVADRHYHHHQSKQSPSSRSSKREESSKEVDYKALYEKECVEKEKLARNLNRLNKDLQKAQEEVQQLKNNSNRSPNSKNNTISEEDHKEIERLREENKKMKEANNALIRVITRLSNNANKSNS